MQARDARPLADAMPQSLFSAVIPVFNSQDIVRETVLQTIRFFESKGHRYEIILVNDGSSDDSWDVISSLALEHERVKAIDLLRNYGQHHANLCGFRAAKGDYVITLDDDMQNPPREIEKLIEVAAGGYDLVIGRFKEKKHSFIRRLGSKLIGYINRKIFLGEKDLVLTNFRIIRRDVVDRICASKSYSPYIPGLVLMFSSNRKNVWVDHCPRPVGSSNYSMYRILRLVSTVLFNYSSIPLRFMAAFGFVLSLLSLLLALFYFLKAIFAGASIPGWSTLVILLSFFNGILLLLISVVGEYVVRLLKENVSTESYYIKRTIE